MSSQIVPFLFKGYQVRTYTDTLGAPWFVATDLCAVLGIGNSRQALTALDNDEKGVINSDTPGGVQELATVNEPGMYSLVLRSRKPHAREFKRWLTHDVIPSIRKTGGYGVQQPSIDQLDRRTLAQMVIDAEDAKAAAELERDVAELEASEAKKVAENAEAACEVFEGVDGILTVADMVKLIAQRDDLSIRQCDARSLMKSWNWMTYDKADRIWKPMAYGVGQGYVVGKTSMYDHPRTGERTMSKPSVRITAKGVSMFVKKLRKESELALF